MGNDLGVMLSALAAVFGGSGILLHVVRHAAAGVMGGLGHDPWLAIRTTFGLGLALAWSSVGHFGPLRDAWLSVRLALGLGLVLGSLWHVVDAVVRVPLLGLSGRDIVDDVENAGLGAVRAGSQLLKARSVLDGIRTGLGAPRGEQSR